MGAGLVKAYTHINNLDVIRKEIPEAMFYGYKNNADVEKLEELINWCDVILIGPGLGTSGPSLDIFNKTMEIGKNKKMVIDADALNILNTTVE